MAAQRSPSAADTWQQQDGVVIGKARADLTRGSHVQYRWDQRAPDAWEGYPVRAAYREADTVAAWSGSSSVVRDHEPSGMRLISRWGFLVTCFPSSDLDGPSVTDPEELRSASYGLSGGDES